MKLVVNLLDDIERFCDSKKIEVILTLNIDEELGSFSYSFPLSVIKNKSIKGFGANHNQAFNVAIGQYFCVMNPDIRLINDPFPPLIGCLEDAKVGIAAPVIRNELNSIEDSARPFPSPFSVVLRVVKEFLGVRPVKCDERYEWVGGMFMLLNTHTYRLVNGFDERYFMYYEDVDICARLTNLGKHIKLCQSSCAIHLAQRSSHRSLRHLRWHISSMMRFFISKAYWSVLWR